MAERSFAKEVEDLRLGTGRIRGEGVLAITKALLQSGVGYVAGCYQGAPISHLVGVLADAQDILGELGVHFEASASEMTANGDAGRLL